MRKSAAERQQEYQARKREARKAGPMVLCACGCGEEIPAINALGQPATYKHGHNPGNEATRFKPGQEAWNKGKEAPWAKGNIHGRALKGKYVGPLNHAFGKPGHRKGILHTPEAKAKMSAALKGRFAGEKNPFYGKHHPPELLAQIGAKLSQKRRIEWVEGESGRPYPPEFSQKLKRLIIKRDRNRCRSCGVKGTKAAPMEVHHIDHVRTHNDPGNLATVCHSCNMYFSYHHEESLAKFPQRPLDLI